MPRTAPGWLFAVVMLVVWTVPLFAQAEEAPPPPALEPSKAQAGIDALALLELYTKHSEALKPATGGVTVHETSIEATLKLCEEQLAVLQNLEENVLPEVEPVLARVTELWAKPGAEEAARAEGDFDAADFAFRQSGEVEWNMKMAAADNDPRAARDLPEEFDSIGTHYSNLARWLGNLHKTRVANAEYLATHVMNQPEITFFVQDKRVDIMKEWRTLLEWALKFDPTNAYANVRLATIGREIAELEQAVEREIDEATWKGHLGDFPGPGTVGDLARAALDYLRRDRDWGNQGEEPAKLPDGTVKPGVEVVAVAVRGPWQVAETDIFGRVLSWRLPVHVAVTKPDLKAKNIARVYELSMVTPTGLPGRVEKAPPFDGFWVGDSWMMRLNKLPQGN